MEIWNEQKVKDVLPDVRIMLQDGKIRTGYVRGRNLPFAIVRVNLATGDTISYEYAWATIARIVQTGSYLKV